MRNLVVLIILATGAYFGWKAWNEQPEWLVRLLPKSGPVATESSAPPETGSGSKNRQAPPGGSATPTPQKFVSRIASPTEEVSGGGGKVAPGTFLVIQRISAETKDGVIAIVPGDQVRLVERHKNGTLTVTNGRADFIVKESKVTQDIAIGKAAELQEFQKRIGHTR